MRPERSIVKKAIVDAKGNLSKASALLGCSRPTLYQWIYQLGLAREAGIRIDTRDGLNTRERKDTDGTKSELARSHLFNRGTPVGSIVPPMGTAAPETDLPTAATIRVRESLWKQVKIRAIQNDLSLSQYVEQLFEAALSSPAALPKPKKGAGK